MSIEVIIRPAARATILGVLIAGTLLIWPLLRPTAQGQDEAGPAKVVISGRVLNPQGVALPATPVYLYLKGLAQPLRRFADINGQFHFEIDPTPEIPKLLFDNEQWHVRVVEEISGQYNSEINKVLPLKEGPKNFALIVDQIMVYDRLRIEDEVRGQNFPDGNILAARRAGFRARFGSRVLSIPHPLRRNIFPPNVWAQGETQWDVIDKLTPAEQLVINRMTLDLLWRLGYFAERYGSYERVTSLPPGVGLPVIVPMPDPDASPVAVPAVPDFGDVPVELPAGAVPVPVPDDVAPAPAAPAAPAPRATPFTVGSPENR